MINRIRIPLSNLVVALSKAIDLISQDVANHHLQVSYIALSIATEIGLTAEEKNNLAIAGALHDIGALSLKDRLDALEFEIEQPHKHAEVGYLLLDEFEPLADVAHLVRNHHVNWDKAESFTRKNQKLDIGCYILHLADRISVLIRKDEDILGQTGRIFNTIAGYSGTKFAPELVEAFHHISEREYFWLDVTSPFLETIISRRVSLPALSLDLNELLGLAKIFSRIIDFRSSFTATHSAGVASVGEKLAELSGFSGLECKMMRIAGYLHDLGKIAVPDYILNKPGPLTEKEFNMVRRHTYYTYQILSQVNGLEQITAWASFHHEQLDGSGYPFHLRGNDIPVFSRILAVADIFTALTEDRPYRKGMVNGSALNILQGMASSGKIDPKIVLLLKDNFEEINALRKTVQANSADDYRKFIRP